MQEYKEEIENAINQLLSGELSVVAFKRVFYWFYLEQVPGELLSDEEWYLYSAIDAALDRIAAAADHQDFIEWVRNQRQQHITAELAVRPIQKEVSA